MISPKSSQLLNLLKRSALEFRPLSASVTVGGLFSEALSLSTQRRHKSAYRPVFSLPESTKHLRQPSNDLAGLQSRRSAITSSGFYAPLNPLTDNRRTQINQELRGNATVFEDSDHLPSLPVPEVNLTLERLKESISPVAMNSSEFVNTLQLIDEFATTAGPKLDLLLRSKAIQKKNWLADDWWINETYLKSRNSLVINSNPAMIYPSFPFEISNQRSFVNTTAKLISGIIDFKLALIQGYNPEATNSEDEFRLDGNLCYSQYKHIFGTTRIPGEAVDSISLSKTLPAQECQSSESFNLVVSHRGQFFEVQLNNIEDEKARNDQLVRVLDKIIALGQEGPQGVAGVGALTAANRSDWAKAFKLLDPESTNAIRDAQFVVCIDTIPEDSQEFSSALLTSPSGSEAHMATLGRQVLHADGANVGNRWFDKAIQLILIADGKSERLLGAGINYEHTCAEGIVITKMIEYSYDRAVQRSRESSSSSNFFDRQQISAVSHQPTGFRQLRMLLDDEGCENEGEISHYLKRARDDHLAHIGQFDLSYLDYRHYGSNSIKSWNLSPDSWVQVAILSGYYDAHKRFGICYETASTRQFAYGRTETIRSLTKEVAQYCLDPNRETLQSAVKSHKAYARLANNGQAIDRALLGYRMAFNELRSNNWSWGLESSVAVDSKSAEIVEKVKREGQNTADLSELFSERELSTISAFFNNDLIRRSTRYALSTSQVSSLHSNIYMTYGPILADGYGCCYNITGQRIVAAITANSSNQSFSCEVNKLNNSIQRSLDRMRNIMEESRSKSGSS